ncbi:MAG TPA: cytochrome P450 [Pseudonocardiaceae bacterium]
MITDPVDALTDEAYLDNPRPLYHWLRQHRPVCPMRPGQVALTRYQDAHLVVRDPRFRRPGPADIAAAYPEAGRRRAMRLFFGSMAFRNPPELAPLRKLVTRELTPRRMNALAGTVTELSDRLLDGVEERLRDGETVDLHQEFALGIARAVLADLLGIPEADRDWMGESVNRIITVVDPLSTKDQLDAADDASRQVGEYLGELAALRRKDPREDLISAWVNPADGTNPLDNDELTTLMWGIWIAGFESTASGIDHGLLVLARHPESAAWLDGDPARVAAYVNEVVRYEPQVMLTSVSWLATEDVPVQDTVIPAGTDVRLLMGALNHDPAVFPDPDRFDPARPAVQSFAFNQGPHHCVGRALAEMEMSVALGGVRRRLPGLALVGLPRRVPTLSLRRFARLPMALDR